MRGLFSSGLSAKTLASPAVTGDNIQNYLPTQRLKRNLQARVEALTEPAKFVKNQQDAIDKLEKAVGDKYEATFKLYKESGFSIPEAQKFAAKQAKREFEEGLVLLEAQFPKVLQGMSLAKIAKQSAITGGWDV